MVECYCNISFLLFACTVVTPFFLSSSEIVPPNKPRLENCALLRYGGNSLPTFWDNLSVPSSRIENP